jgi:diadenosine tetraphosphate (Ap4A) HIT family hydrolase
MLTDLERALNDGTAPWAEIEQQNDHYWIIRDAYPVTQGHLLFVPTQDRIENLLECYRAAYFLGHEGISTKQWDGFNVGQNCGTSAGQTVMYPHVHMIPRRTGDMEDPRGGVRHVIPEKGNYKNADKSN